MTECYEDRGEAVPRLVRDEPVRQRCLFALGEVLVGACDGGEDAVTEGVPFFDTIKKIW